MIILNAIYFKGEWFKTFEKEFTTKQTFYNLNKNEKKVDMMEIIDHYNYFEDANLQSIELFIIKNHFLLWLFYQRKI